MSDICNEILVELDNIANEINSTEVVIPDLDNSFLTPIKKINNELGTFDKQTKISHLNVVSIPNHRDEIYRIINSTKKDIIGISETNIKKATPNKMFKMDGYNFFMVIEHILPKEVLAFM